MVHNYLKGKLNLVLIVS